MTDRRRHTRKRVDLPASLELPGQPSASACVCDLSVGGAYVESAASAVVGTKVVLDVAIPGNRQLRIDCILRWTKPGGVGLEFGLLGVRETFALTQFLESVEVVPTSAPD